MSLFQLRFGENCKPNWCEPKKKEENRFILVNEESRRVAEFRQDLIRGSNDGLMSSFPLSISQFHTFGADITLWPHLDTSWLPAAPRAPSFQLPTQQEMGRSGYNLPSQSLIDHGQNNAKNWLTWSNPDHRVDWNPSEADGLKDGTRMHLTGGEERKGAVGRDANVPGCPPPYLVISWGQKSQLLRAQLLYLHSTGASRGHQLIGNYQHKLLTNIAQPEKKTTKIFKSVAHQNLALVIFFFQLANAIPPAVVICVDKVSVQAPHVLTGACGCQSRWPGRMLAASRMKFPFTVKNPDPVILPPVSTSEPYP